MLSDDKPKIYWDACVPLSYINGHANRLPDIEGLMQKSGQDFYLVTSIFSIVEVAFAQVEQKQTKLDPTQEEKIAKLWRLGSPIQLVEFYELIAQKARNLMRAAIPEGWSLRTGDAVHLATADHLKVSAFHTYDERLDKYEKITETHFKICRPLATQPVIVMVAPEEEHEPEAVRESTPAAEGKADADQSAKPDEQPQVVTEPAPLQGSSSSGTPSETAGETKIEAKETPKSEVVIPAEKPKPADKGGLGEGGS